MLYKLCAAPPFLTSNFSLLTAFPGYLATIQQKKTAVKRRSLGIPGGDEGSRTPVQKACPINFSECSSCLRVKQSTVQEQTTFAELGIDFPPKSQASFFGILLIDVSLRS